VDNGLFVFMTDVQQQIKREGAPDCSTNLDHPVRGR
jgi:hypothetical protein